MRGNEKHWHPIPETIRQQRIRGRINTWADCLGHGHLEEEPFPDLSWGEGKEELSVDDVVDRIFADSLGFLFVHCFTPQGCSLDVAHRRFLALVYIYRPDLISGRSVAQIAKEVNVTKGAIGQHLSDMRKEIGAIGLNSLAADKRRAIRAGQIIARLRKEKDNG